MFAKDELYVEIGDKRNVTEEKTDTKREKACLSSAWPRSWAAWKSVCAANAWHVLVQ